VVPDGFITPNAPVGLGGESVLGLALYPIPDEAFSKILPVTREPVTGILVNTATFSDDQKKRETVPYQCDIGMKIPLIVGFAGQAITAQIIDGDYDAVNQLLDLKGGKRGDITLGAVVNEIPGTIIAPLFDSYRVNVLIPQSVYEALYAEYEKDFQPLTETVYTVVSPDPEAFCKAAGELLAPNGKFGVSGGIVIQNVAQMTRFNQNITLLVMLFGYGFIGMLSLIAVTSVIATISTGMALRRQEFAMLYSVGMTPEGMNKMLNLESLLYGSKSLLIGLPVGVVLSYLIYWGMSATFQFAYELPLTAIIISIAAVMMLTFGTMRYSKRKLRGISIVEAIRSETV
jgi:hypothetical protein